MLVLGLTGGIACGKSNVSDVLQQLGAVIVDGDILSRRLTGPGGPALPAIRDAFGGDVFSPDGTLDRKALGELVFGDDTARKKLDDLIQPALKSMILEEMDSAQSRGAEVCVLDMPLLYEKNLEPLCDRVWAVYVPLETQLERLMARDGYSPRQAGARVRSQMSALEKAERADVVIDTSGTIEETRAKIPALYEKELERIRQSKVSEITPTQRGAETAGRPATSSAASADVTAPTTARRRRSDAYQTPANTPVSHMPSTPVSRASSVPVSRVPSTPPETMERPRSATAKKDPAARRRVEDEVPRLLKISLLSCTLAIAIVVTAIFLMQAFQKRKTDEMTSASARVLARYPEAGRYADWISQYAEEYNLDPAFVTAIILNESSFDPMAVSSVGARGLMQMMPDTAEWISGKLKLDQYSFDRMFDPETNIRFGCWYLNFLADRFGGDVISVICAYHAGQGEIAGWLSDPSMSDDGQHLILENLKAGPTRTYAERVTKAYGIYKVLYTPDPDVADTGSGPVSGQSAPG